MTTNEHGETVVFTGRSGNTYNITQKASFVVVRDNQGREIQAHDSRVFTTPVRDGRGTQEFTALQSIKVSDLNAANQKPLKDRGLNPADFVKVKSTIAVESVLSLESFNKIRDAIIAKNAN
jgi:hypothetical protein